MSAQKPHRLRVKVRDGKKREPNRLKGLLVPHVDVFDTGNGIEFVVCAVKEAHLDQVRPKLGTAGLEEIPGGDTSLASPAPKPADSRGGPQEKPGEAQGRPPPVPPQRAGGPGQAPQSSTPALQKKPYGFVPLPDDLTTTSPVWHDGSAAAGRLSGEIRCELQTLTPLLVGWERREIGDAEEPWPVAHTSLGGESVEVKLDGAVISVAKQKSVLCALRAPWNDRPVLLPGDSLKGLLRHELGALLGAPMERVAERSYSYRPNSLFARNSRLIARVARVARDSVVMKPLNPEKADSQGIRVPVKLELLPENLAYDKQHEKGPPRYRFDAPGGAAYRGGQGAGVKLNSKRQLHSRLEAQPSAPVVAVPVPEAVQTGYRNTLRHLIDDKYGHFSERHPDVPKVIEGEVARQRILYAAANVVFQPGDLIWVEWDTQKQSIVSLGWHYYYRWAYVDTVRKKGGEKGWMKERRGLYPLDEEKALDGTAPRGLSPVRRLFGYTGDNDGSAGIGADDHAQLMGRLSVNAAIEVVESGDTDGSRFLRPTFLRELGMPRPSAVEHYIEQPPAQRLNQWRKDKASLVTYGDAAGYDTPGNLAGRKFYLDRKDAYTGEPWKDESEANRLNDRSTLAIEASPRGRRFRFAVRFRDLDAAELATVLAALCPHQFRDILGGNHADGYCSKFGYARPLGWGSVRIEAKELLLLDTSADRPALTPLADPLDTWMRKHFAKTPMLQQWLAIHRHKHPDAGDYPTEADKEGKENIYTYHTNLRAKHSRDRRYGGVAKS